MRLVINIIIITGVAGFIGFHCASTLLMDTNYKIIGIDNLNDYYSTDLKNNRLSFLKKYKANFEFYQVDIERKEDLKTVFDKYPNTEYVIHLAAQAGVRYSISNPHKYITSNIMGHLNLLEICKSMKEIKHFVYASSSSVYGRNSNLPFIENDLVDRPASIYAVSKRTCELISYVYSEMNSIMITGLRYFTVYGPWGRPDMSPYLFTTAILLKKEIQLFNQGKMKRNFTYIDDVVQGTLKCLFNRNAYREQQGYIKHKIYNIGGLESINLIDFIEVLSKEIGLPAKLKLSSMQPGEVKETAANIDSIVSEIGYFPKVKFREGIKKYVEWHRSYYK